MQGDQVFLGEFLLLAAWLGAPALAAGLGLEAAVLVLKGMGRPGQRIRLAVALAASGLFAYGATVTAWVLLPPLPESVFMLSGVLLLPAVIGVILACPSIGWYVLRTTSGRTSGCSG